MLDFQERVHYRGDLSVFLQKICADFTIGLYQSYVIIPMGYEDFNLLLKTDRGTFFVKIFAASRNEKECIRYVDIIKKIVHADISHPKLYRSNQGFLYTSSLQGSDKLIVMEHIEGKTFYELQISPSKEEMRFILEQVARINKLHLKPSFMYDHWAIINLTHEYEEKKKYLTKADEEYIKPLTNIFKTFPFKDLPHCFVHGDIIKTNVIKSTSGKIYILDFAVSNWYPRIQELAVLLCDLFFTSENPDFFQETYDFVISEYQKYIPLTPKEIQLLPTYIQFAHAMHVVLANYEKEACANTSAENEYFLNLGRKGLQMIRSISTG